MSAAAHLLLCKETPHSPLSFVWWPLHSQKCMSTAIDAMLLGKLLCLMSLITSIGDPQKAPRDTFSILLQL